MALARLALKNLQQRVLASPSCVQRQRWGNEIVRRFTTTASDKVAGEKTSDGKDVAVSEAKKKSKLLPRKQRRRWLWKNDDPNFVPALYGTSLSLSLSLSQVSFFIRCLLDIEFFFPSISFVQVIH